MGSASRPSTKKVNYWSENHDQHPTARHTMVRRPDTKLEALMETAPGDVPRDSWEDVQDLRDIVAAAVDMLPSAIERRVLEALFVQQLSLRKASIEVFGIPNKKDTIARVRDQALVNLKTLLLCDDEIAERYQ